MNDAADNLPDEMSALKALVASQREEIERLRQLLAQLRRLVFGGRSEKFTTAVEQLELRLEELEASAAELSRQEAAPKAAATPKPPKTPLPAHLPREMRLYPPEHSGCPDCGGRLARLGELPKSYNWVLPNLGYAAPDENRTFETFFLHNNFKSFDLQSIIREQAMGHLAEMIDVPEEVEEWRAYLENVDVEKLMEFVEKLPDPTEWIPGSAWVDEKLEEIINEMFRRLEGFDCELTGESE